MEYAIVLFAGNAATYTFLVINGARLTASSRVTQKFVVTLYARKEFTFDKLLPWFRKHIVFEEES